MVSNPSLKSELERHRFKNVLLWRLGVDTSFFVCSEKHIAELPSPVFVYCGRIAKEKSLETFLDLDLPGTKLMIGDGPERQRLKNLYQGKALFVGYKKGQELVHWLSLGDVFVCPSVTETFGLAMVEALSCGIPVAAHNVMGPKDIIENGVDGVLNTDLRLAALGALSLSREKCRAKALTLSLDASADLFLAHVAAYPAHRQATAIALPT